MNTCVPSMIYRSGRGCSIAAYLSAGKEFNEAIFSNEMKKRFDIIFLELWYEINSRLYLKMWESVSEPT